MSASPAPPPTAQSQKRPLEEPSSETGLTDQPEAKRPALEKDDVDGLRSASAQNGNESAPLTVRETSTETTETLGNGAVKETTDVDTTEATADGSSTLPPASAVLETQPIQSTTTRNGASGTQSPTASQNVDETGWLHIRSIISSAEAATIIGKGGENVTLIRRMSGAKCTVSDYSRGAVERILTVSGLVDAIAKAFGLIIRTLNQEPLEAPSNAQSKTYPLRLLIPHILIGSIIGQKGVRIKEIQEASGARLNASDSALPLSTERSLVVLGVADAVHIATYYVGSTLVEQLTERFGGPAASAYATRSGGPAGVVPGGMQVVPYTPQPAGGNWGHPDSYRRHPTQQPQRQPANAYGVPYSQQHSAPSHHQQASMGYGAAAPRHGYGAGPQVPQGYAQPHQASPQGYQSAAPQNMGGGAAAAAAAAGGAAMPGQPLTQQIYIPNDMVGAIIGKGGAKINEIRQLSGSVIKINEPQDNSNERLVTITGTQECNQMALYMLYQRLGQQNVTPRQASKAA